MKFASIVAKYKYLVTKWTGDNTYHMILPLLIAFVMVLGVIGILVHLAQADFETATSTIRLAVTVSSTFLGFLLVGLQLAVNKRAEGRGHLRSLIPKYFMLLSQKEAAGLDIDLVELLRQTYVRLLKDRGKKLDETAIAMGSTKYTHRDLLFKISSLSELTVEYWRHPTNEAAIREDFKVLGCSESTIAEYNGHVFLARLEPTIFFRDLDGIVFFPHSQDIDSLGTKQFSLDLIAEMGKDGVIPSLESISRLSKSWGHLLAILISAVTFSLVSGFSLSLGLTKAAFSTSIAEISIGVLFASVLLSLIMLLVYIGEIIKV